MSPVTALAVLGLLNAAYLYWQHRQVARGRTMFCLLGGDCEAIVESNYGRSFGVKNEIWGLAYYLLLILAPYLNFTLPITFIAVISATLFSLYLFCLQAFVLKKFCSWCLIAIAVNLSIFLYLLFI